MNAEQCGRPFYHDTHVWQEGPAGDVVYHYCDGGSDEAESLDAHELQDALFEQGAYEGRAN